MKLKSRIVVVIAIAMVSISALTSCGKNEASHTIQDVLGSDGAYCLTSEGVIREGGLIYNADDEEDEGYLYAGQEPLIVDTTKGDHLILTGKTVNDFEESLTGEDRFAMDWRAEKYYWSGEEVNLLDIVELEGQNIEGKLDRHIKDSPYKKLADEVFGSYGLEFHAVSGDKGSIVSKSPSNYSYGYYNGTKWTEVNAVNNVPLYEITFDTGWAFLASVEKTKDGYFLVDLSGVEPGLYVNAFHCGDQSTYVFEII